MSATPQILVIIVTWNKKQYVLDLLASLANIDYPSSALTLLVVDNASTDGTVDALKSTYPQVILLCNQENLGGTGGFNTGLQWAFNQPVERFDYLWLLDNDVVVHRQALKELVAILQTKPDVAVAGSTMMQLDYPWRINEMGAYLNRGNGNLVLNRHLEKIPFWQGHDISELLQMDCDLTKHLMHCRPYMDVDYVAAASLLIRAPVAREAGLWRDYFIHFDDVEWCLRIANKGYRVVVAAKSLIWHLSAAAKVPTWVLYYDNRNILDLLKVHGADARHLHRLVCRVLLKAVYYFLIGKADLAELHHQAVMDFRNNHFGKKSIQLAQSVYRPNSQIAEVFRNPQVKRLLLVWTVNLQATGIQETLAQIQLQRPDLEITQMCSLEGNPYFQLPRSHFLPPLSLFKIKRWWAYWRLRNNYDLVVQSDYQPIIGLSWLNSPILFVNDEGFCLYPRPQLKQVFKAALQFFKEKWR